jgi:hypothetical protein
MKIRKWTQEELAALPELAKTHSIGDVAKMFGRSSGSVFHKAQYIGVRFTNPETSTAIGKKAERIGCELLKGAIWTAEHNPNFEYDLEWEGKRVNVKSAIPQYRERGKYPRWSWKIGGAKPFCDLFLLLGFAENKDLLPVKAWLIPSDAAPEVNLRISVRYMSCQYSKYEIEVNVA